uniref:Uncharacterized protein n=1 Tax=Parascaris univalens TaxID=6257 RepID=A0A915CHX9_PARUN
MENRKENMDFSRRTTSLSNMKETWFCVNWSSVAGIEPGPCGTGKKTSSFSRRTTSLSNMKKLGFVSTGLPLPGIEPGCGPQRTLSFSLPLRPDKKAITDYCIRTEETSVIASYDFTVEYEELVCVDWSFRCPESNTGLAGITELLYENRKNIDFSRRTTSLSNMKKLGFVSTGLPLPGVEPGPCGKENIDLASYDFTVEYEETWFCVTGLPLPGSNPGLAGESRNPNH